MLSITECKKILNKNGISYSDKEVEIIRNFLYQIAQMQLESKQKNNN
jgi:hypothetical protein